jgi:hypothetical protein
VRYEVRPGLEGLEEDWDIDTLDAERASDDRPGAVRLLAVSALDEVPLVINPRRARVSILGASSSVSQLHYRHISALSRSIVERDRLP